MKYVFLVCGVVLGVAALVLTQSPVAYPASIEVPSAEDQLFIRTNHERSVPLQLDTNLQKQAYDRAVFLCTHPFTHDGWQQAFGTVDYTHIGENLARNYTDATTTNIALLQSPEHRKNILDPIFTDIGIGYVMCLQSPYGTQYSVVELFGGYNQ